MGIIKRLFGSAGKTDEDTGKRKPDIDELIASKDLNGSIIALDNHISDLCDYGENLEKLNASQKIFFLNQTLEREINNGGFNQFYFNASGDHAHATVGALKAIEAHHTADILSNANDQFPGQKVPRNRSDRQDILAQVEAAANPIWEGLDEKFYEYADDLNSLNLEFIKKHRTDFS